ncbi:MAG: hypothetical protein ACF8QF_09330 [Phycisphaerales bacterium]
MAGASLAARSVATLEALHPGGAPALAVDDAVAHDIELHSGETVILAVRAHWLLFFASVLPVLVGVALVSIVLLGVQISFGPGTARPVVIGLALVGVLGVVFAFLEQRNRLYILTDRRIIRRSGALRVRIGEVALPDIDTVEVREGASGDAPDRVGILIYSGASAKMAWEFVPEPRRIRAAAREAIERYGKPGRPRTGPA